LNFNRISNNDYGTQGLNGKQEETDLKLSVMDDLYKQRRQTEEETLHRLSFVLDKNKFIFISNVFSTFLSSDMVKFGNIILRCNNLAITNAILTTLITYNKLDCLF